jgi:hypothetical protein
MKRIQGALRNRGLLYFYMSTSEDIIYYTDWHDVDEDMRTIASYGGHYNAEGTVGIMDRNPSSNFTEVYEFVASIHNITQHNN